MNRRKLKLGLAAGIAALAGIAVSALPATAGTYYDDYPPCVAYAQCGTPTADWAYIWDTNSKCSLMSIKHQFIYMSGGNPHTAWTSPVLSGSYAQSPYQPHYVTYSGWGLP